MLIKNLFHDYNIHKVIRHNRISPHHPYRISLNGSRFKIQEEHLVIITLRTSPIGKLWRKTEFLEILYSFFAISTL